MTGLAALTLLLAAAPSAAQEAAVPAAAAQAVAVSTPAVQLSTAPAAVPLPAWRVPPLRRLAVELNRLIERGGALPPERLGPIEAQAVLLRQQLREALGREVIEAAEREEEPARAAAALEALAAFRKALRAWYAANGGKYPASTSELVPGLLPAPPELHLPGHEPSEAVTLIDSKKYDKDVSKAAADSGGWLYFADPGSDNYGLLLIDCTHTHPAGEEFYKY